jgi:TM2 domain-containing membrane protein YozV
MVSESAVTTPVTPTEAGPPLLPPPPTVATIRQVKSPGLALLLSTFPGMGQVYNGQPAKAFVMFLSWAISIYLTAEVNPMPFAFFIPFTYFYNLIDAYRSAVFINARPVVVEEEQESPGWGIAMIVLGLVLLLHNFDLIRLQSLHRYWPVLLIIAGAAFLRTATRRTGSGSGDGQP